MLDLLKIIWSRVTGQRSAAHPSPCLPRAADWPDDGPLPELEAAEPTTHYVLPLRWSLHYALTEKQWRTFRDRHKELYPDSDRCSCPKHCKANTLDEKWSYDSATHTKIFLSATFICPGCHWFKTPPWRILTWIKQENGLLPTTVKPPHIVDCLGWTQQQVDALRERDLKKHQMELVLIARLEQQVQHGRAAMLPAPPERLSPQQLESLVKPGQVMVVPWRVDLTALTRYGYTQDEIAIFEQRMFKLAAKRMAVDDDGSGRRA